MKTVNQSWVRVKAPAVREAVEPVVSHSNCRKDRSFLNVVRCGLPPKVHCAELHVSSKNAHSYWTNHSDRDNIEHLSPCNITVNIDPIFAFRGRQRVCQIMQVNIQLIMDRSKIHQPSSYLAVPKFFSWECSAINDESFHPLTKDISQWSDSVSFQRLWSSSRNTWVKRMAGLSINVCGGFSLLQAT